jgi:hypothetical protein
VLSCKSSVVVNTRPSATKRSVKKPIVSQSLDLGYFRCSYSNRLFEAAQIAKSCKLYIVVYRTSESTMAAMLRGR